MNCHWFAEFLNMFLCSVGLIDVLKETLGPFIVAIMPYIVNIVIGYELYFSTFYPCYPVLPPFQWGLVAFRNVITDEPWR